MIPVYDDEETHALGAQGEARDVVGHRHLPRPDSFGFEQGFQIRYWSGSEAESAPFIRGKALALLDRLPPAGRLGQRIRGDHRQIAVDPNEPLEVLQLSGQSQTLAEARLQRAAFRGVNLRPEKRREHILFSVFRTEEVPNVASEQSREPVELET
ncbi:MAG: hypothetical protein SF066_22655 [Thermoanaerobaculia bacterium]|nr:hypothetical protein [Thermoanaerobaculia bacterium]